MPRKGRGGSRTGASGKAYGNRTDLNGGKVPMAAAPNQTYGKAGEQLAAQRAVPVAAPPAPAAPAGPLPGSFGPLTRPTERPSEPLTAGAPFGAGPSTLPGVGGSGVAEQLRALYMEFPTEELRQLIEDL